MYRTSLRSSILTSFRAFKIPSFRPSAVYVRVLLISLFCVVPIYSQFVPKQSLSTEKLSNNYSPQFLYLLQIAFGSEAIVSQGGYDSIDLMFASIDLNNKKVLDIGSGFGGVDIYLAQQFNLEIVGVDIEPYMMAMAEEFLSQHKDTLLGNVAFLTLQETCKLNEFEDDTFDIIFSKETFYNVPRGNKQSYLAEVYRKLKPGGMLIISDWFQGMPIAGEFLKRASKNEKICQFITPEACHKILEEIHFEAIEYIDLCEDHLRYTREDCERLIQNAGYISEHFGEETYKKTAQSWKDWLEAQEAGELLSGIFFAKKPCPLGMFGEPSFTGPVH